MVMFFQVQRTLPSRHAGQGTGVLPETPEILCDKRPETQTPQSTEEKVCCCHIYRFVYRDIKTIQNNLIFIISTNLSKNDSMGFCQILSKVSLNL